MRLALDSNRYSDFRHSEPRAVEVLRSADEIHLPLMVLGELRAGFAHGARRSENERLLTQFLGSSRVHVIAPDEQTTYFYADLFAYLRKAGRPTPANDIWIAAIAVQHSLVLFTRDKHFEHFPQLARI